MIQHSEKGLKTLEAMNTKPENWGLTPIKFEKRIVPVMVWVKCQNCDGQGNLYTVAGSDKKLTAREAMKALKFPAHCVEGGSSFYIRNNKAAEASACPVCPYVRPTRTGRAYLWEQNGRQGFSDTHQEQGFVKELRNVEREVAIVLWAKGTAFDSRFDKACDQCALCAKVIPSQRFVPVNGQSPDGVVHGMWIGEDCARKFFGIKAFKKEQIIERK